MISSRISTISSLVIGFLFHFTGRSSFRAEPPGASYDTGPSLATLSLSASYCRGAMSQENLEAIALGGASG
jgi:hypothetical protein